MDFLVRCCKFVLSIPGHCSCQLELTALNRHIHWLQTEYFQVESGVIGIMKNEKELAATKDDGIIEIPPGTR
jgi:hypothetical protein